MGRKLMISRNLEKPIQEIKALANRSSYISDVKSIPKYRLYSEHDTDVANVLGAIYPVLNYTYIPYASNIYFELY